MKIVHSPKHAGHAPMFTVESCASVEYFDRPSRVEAIMRELSKNYPRRDFVEAYADPLDAALDVQDPVILQRIHEVRASTLFMKRDYPSMLIDDAVPISGGTYPAVVGSASAALSGAEIILSGAEDVVYSLCRPPGHHASKTMIGGYCFLNNAALAASRLAESGLVFILDIDRHSGNGTQSIVLEDERMFLYSINAEGVYPNINDGECSCHLNDRNVVNVNLPPGTDDSAYRIAVEQAKDIMACVSPKFLVVSAGFDTSARELPKLDNVPVFGITSNGFYEIGKSLGNAGMPTLVVQEGGYNPLAVGEDVSAFLEGINS